MSMNPFAQQTIPSAAPRYHQGRKMFGGRYTLQRRIGRGGMGEVWLAQDNELGVQRALKFAPPEVAADARSVALLKREAIAGTSLAHPNIVRIFDFVQDAREHESAVVMEAVEGKSLAEIQAVRIEETGGGFFEPEEVECWLREACSALDYAHEEGRVHRDLKPQNLMVERATGRLRILDFGISRRIGDSHATLTGIDSSGTLPYMSPQQVNGDAPSSSDDIYGLGATLYDMLTGSPPFCGGDIPSQVRDKPPTPPNQRRLEVNGDAGKPIPEVWVQTALICMSKEREDRPSRAGDVCACIQNWRREEKDTTGTQDAVISDPEITADETPDSESPAEVMGMGGGRGRRRASSVQKPSASRWWQLFDDQACLDRERDPDCRGLAFLSQFLGRRRSE